MWNEDVNNNSERAQIEKSEAKCWHRSNNQPHIFFFHTIKWFEAYTNTFTIFFTLSSVEEKFTRSSTCSLAYNFSNSSSKMVTTNQHNFLKKDFIVFLCNWTEIKLIWFVSTYTHAFLNESKHSHSELFSQLSRTRTHYFKMNRSIQIFFCTFFDEWTMQTHTHFFDETVKSSK